tara:strand:- start:124 stop:1410 length:1287 start_codon:yes stop_codon:yes gene_type:complete
MIHNIVITHGYSDSNKGDLAITQATVSILKKKFPKANITLMSTFRIEDPDFWFHNRKMKENDIDIIQGILPTPYLGSDSSFIINLMAVARLVKDIIQLKISINLPFLGKYIGGKQHLAVNTIKKADLVVVKGGQFIYNDKEDLRGNLFLWRTLQPIKVAHQLNKKNIIFGQSVGGFATTRSEKTAAKYLKLCDKVLVREKLSYDLLSKYNVKNLELMPDTAFYIDKKEVEINFNNIEDKDVLGITVVNWNFAESNNPEKAKEQYISNLIYSIEESTVKLNLFPVFIPQVTVKHHGKSDLDLINLISIKLNEKGIKHYTIKEDYSASEMVCLYSKCKLLIGTRLHSCILAAVAGIPVIAIRYQGFKTQGVMDMLGFGHFVHDIHYLDGNKLLKDVESILKDYTVIKTKVINTSEVLKKEIEQRLKEFNK